MIWWHLGTIPSIVGSGDVGHILVHKVVAFSIRVLLVIISNSTHTTSIFMGMNAVKNWLKVIIRISDLRNFYTANAPLAHVSMKSRWGLCRRVQMEHHRQGTCRRSTIVIYPWIRCSSCGIQRGSITRREKGNTGYNQRRISHLTRTRNACDPSLTLSSSLTSQRKKGVPSATLGIWNPQNIVEWVRRQSETID